jgi:hypothetical protein
VIADTGGIVETTINFLFIVMNVVNSRYSTFLQ